MADVTGARFLRENLSSRFLRTAFGFCGARRIQQDGIDDSRRSNQPLLVHGNELKQRSVGGDASEQGDRFVWRVGVAGHSFVQVAAAAGKGSKVSQYGGRGVICLRYAQKILRRRSLPRSFASQSQGGG